MSAHIRCEAEISHMHHHVTLTSKCQRGSWWLVKCHQHHADSMQEHHLCSHEIN